MAFVICSPISLGHHVGFSVSKRSQWPHCRHVTCCSVKPPNVEGPSIQQDSSPLLPAATLKNLLCDTMLANRPLTRVFSSTTEGFSNEAFFEAQLGLGGVPSLVLGRTTGGRIFGAYTAFGFVPRDDYREASTSRALFVFTVLDGEVVVATCTDQVQYDFYDYAIRFGSARLGIPMNPRKHIMKANVGTSSCLLPDGSTSVFGDSTMATLELVEVFVAKQYVDDLREKRSKSRKGIFGRLFG